MEVFYINGFFLYVFPPKSKTSKVKTAHQLFKNKITNFQCSKTGHQFSTHSTQMHHSELKKMLTNAQVKSKNNMHSRLDRGNKSELVHFPNQREKKLQK